MADYNTEILGIEDKPGIVYYSAETLSEFGGYSAEQNTIYINEYNMYNAAETADTISHEYRHKYQHERTEKLPDDFVEKDKIKYKEVHFSKHDYDGLYSPNIDRRTIEVMSIYHDTGMDGNIQVENYDSERAAYISNEAIRANYIADILAKKERKSNETGKIFDGVEETIKASAKFEYEGFENHFRPEHSLLVHTIVLRKLEFLKNGTKNTQKNPLMLHSVHLKDFLGPMIIMILAGGH